MKKEVKRVVVEIAFLCAAHVFDKADGGEFLMHQECDVFGDDCTNCPYEVGTLSIGDTLILYNTDGVMSVELVKADNN
jgi:hypothetical protein